MIDGRRFGELLLLNHGPRFEKHRLVLPIGFGEIGDQAVGASDRIDEVFAEEFGGGLEIQRLIGIRVVRHNDLLRERDGLVEFEGAHFRLDGGKVGGIGDALNGE